MCSFKGSIRFKLMPAEQAELFRTAQRSADRDQITRLYRREECESGCFVEGSPTNLRFATAPGTLESIMTLSERSRARFVVIVREPVSRDIS